MRLLHIVLSATIAVVLACGGALADESRVEAIKLIEVGRFSAQPAGGTLPPGWRPLILSPTKKRTEYGLLEDDSQVVVYAVAESGASGLIRDIRVDPKEFPILQWRWKAPGLNPKADLRNKASDDAVLRVFVAFDGDYEKLGFGDRAMDSMIRMISGQKFPFATLAYAWETSAPKGSLFPHPQTKRVQTFVVESGPERLGQWTTESRNLYEDYRRAFGAEPGSIAAVAIMTDADNTKATASAFFGDIALRRTATGDTAPAAR